MELKKYAQRLRKREYGYPQFTREEIEIAKQNGFVIVYGASDDLMEFEGAIYDETECFEGGTVWINENGVIHSEEATPNGKTIEALWCDNPTEDGTCATWSYKTDIPHETFKIYDDGELYCQGIVFSVDELRRTGHEEIKAEKETKKGETETCNSRNTK